MTKVNFNSQTASDKFQTQKLNSHPLDCLCAECVYQPLINACETMVLVCESALALAAQTEPELREHWQSNLYDAQRSLKLWRLQYKATLVAQEVARHE